MAEHELTLEERADLKAVSAANTWERLAYANIPASEQHGGGSDTAINPLVAAQIARVILVEAGLHERAAGIVTPEVNYRQ